jgi:hypothetical protein
MQQSLYRLTKFLGQGLGSAQPIPYASLYGNLYICQGFSYIFQQDGYLLSDMCLSWTPTPHLVLGGYLLIRQGFISNLITFISKHNHALDMIILFPSSTPSIKDLF